MAKTKRKLSEEEFDALASTLSEKMKDALQRELDDCALPELGGPSTSGVWDGMPTVDSKTVIRLSPIVEELIGRPLEACWVRKGGYESVDEAIDDVIASAKKACTADELPRSKAVRELVSA